MKKPIDRKQIIITSLLALMPMFIGILLWNRLPEKVPVHFGPDGTADATGTKFQAVILYPLLLLGLHLLTLLVPRIDPKRENITSRIYGLVLWIVPAVSLFISALVYPYALGMPVNTNRFAFLFCGILFMVIGNYLPKCRQNYTIGIRIPWTLSDEANWDATHRMTGPLTMAGGFLLILYSLLFRNIGVAVLLVVLAVLVLCPILYSYWLYSRANRSS